MPVSVRTRGYLPHRINDRAIYFVTFRLADSLPRELIGRLRDERRMLEGAGRAGTDVAADRVRLYKVRQVIQQAEKCLDGGLGACHMKDFRVAKIVTDAVQHFDGERYQLLAWCVMPNHVHAVLSLAEKESLGRVLHSWKSYSALEANRLLQRQGRFWQREYFDHLVKNEASLERIVSYVAENPEKAGLRNWPWAGVNLAGLGRSSGGHVG